jgi:hypothetical protein
MADSFLAYIEHLELLTFFSGYPLVYALIQFIAGNIKKQRMLLSSVLIRSLPMAYALTATIFFLLWIREMIIHSGIPYMAPGFDISPLRIWGMLGVFFWVPALAKRPVFSLLHSLVFFALLTKDLITGNHSPSGNDIVSNDMKVYTFSLVLNIASLIIVITAYWIFTKIRSRG